MHAIYFHTSVRNQHDKAKRKAISLSVIALTIAFILFTFPSAITVGYFLKDLLATRNGTIIFVSTSCLSTTYHSLNFIVLLLCNKQFMKELKLMLFKCKRNSRKITPDRKITIKTVVLEQQSII